MTPDQYLIAAQRTKAQPQSDEDPQWVDIVHAIYGAVTEAGELLDVVKKWEFYRKQPDFVNLDEEFGDLLWYVAIYLKARGLSFEQVFDQNIAKLRARYPEKFSEERALERNLEEERRVLERMDKTTLLGQVAEAIVDQMDKEEAERQTKATEYQRFLEVYGSKVTQISGKMEYASGSSVPGPLANITSPSLNAALAHTHFGLTLIGEALSKLSQVLTQGLRPDNQSARGEIAIKLRVAASRIEHGERRDDEMLGRDIWVDSNGICKPGKTVQADQ